VSDESRLQVTRKDDESSLVLSSGRSSVVARGRRDAALLAVPCNKCGEHKGLVFAGCVCADCSKALDKQWAGSIATDWVLIAKQPIEKEGESSWYAASVATRLAVIKELKRREVERGTGPTGVSPKELAAEAAPIAAPPSWRKKFWPPLDWLSAPSPDAELFGLDEEVGFCRYVYPDTTYDQIKPHWAKSNPAGGLVIGGALPEDTSALVQKFGTFLEKIGVTSEQIKSLQQN
jgi:hypothetical protein